MISFLLFLIGAVIFFVGLMKVSFPNYEKSKIGLLYGGIGTVLLVAGMGYAFYVNDQNEERLLLDVARQLNANTSEIVIEDISEGNLLTPSKNTNLRKVYYDDKTYLLEIEGYSVKKIVQQSQK